MRSPLITALLALTSSFDPQVKFQLNEPGPGSNAWPHLGFNDYTFSKSPSNEASTARVFAQGDLFAQAAHVIAKHKAMGEVVPQTYYKKEDGTVVASLRINFRPSGSQGQAQQVAMDVNAEMAELTQRFCDLDGNFEELERLSKLAPAMAVGILRKSVSKLEASQSGDQDNDIPPGL